MRPDEFRSSPSQDGIESALSFVERMHAPDDIDAKHRDGDGCLKILVAFMIAAIIATVIMISVPF